MTSLFECTVSTLWSWLNTLRPKQNGRHFADDTSKRIFLNENVWISIQISLKFVPKGPINNIPALVQMMAWRRSGDKPLSEPMMVSLPTHICVTRPHWVNTLFGTLSVPLQYQFEIGAQHFINCGSYEYEFFWRTEFYPKHHFKQ